MIDLIETGQLGEQRFLDEVFILQRTFQSVKTRQVTLRLNIVTKTLRGQHYFLFGFYFKNTNCLSFSNKNYCYAQQFGQNNTSNKIKINESLCYF